MKLQAFTPKFIIAPMKKVYNAVETALASLGVGFYNKVVQNWCLMI